MVIGTMGRMYVYIFLKSLYSPMPSKSGANSTFKSRDRTVLYCLTSSWPGSSLNRIKFQSEGGIEQLSHSYVSNRNYHKAPPASHRYHQGSL